MSSKDIRKMGDYMPKAIGDWIYVWTRDGKKQSHNRLLISSHGRGVLATSNFGPPKKASLVYYCPNGNTLNARSMIRFLQGDFQSYEIIAPGAAAHDYQLTKFQHANGVSKKQWAEDYDLIQRRIHPDAREERLRGLCTPSPEDMQRWHDIGGAQKLNQQIASMDQSYQAQLANIKPVAMDILTIRKRKWHGHPPTLWTVVALLEREGFHYDEIHCSFCRGFASGENLGDYFPPKAV